MDFEMLDVKAAAKRVGLSVVTLDRYRITGEGPRFAKLGKSVRYRTCDLDEWIESRLVRSTSKMEMSTSQQLPHYAKHDPIAYSIADAVSVSGIGRTNLFRAISEGKVKAVKVGRRTLIPADSLKAFILGETA